MPGQKHSDLLVPMLMSLLAEAECSLRQLDGPGIWHPHGSFTGLRIACGVAQGLALGADLPVLGISTGNLGRGIRCGSCTHLSGRAHERSLCRAISAR